MIGILGKKIGMSRILDDAGNFVPVTYVLCEANEILQVKTQEKDGYNALVLGFDAYAKPSKTRKYKYIKEIIVDDVSSFSVGQKLSAEDIKEVTKADITGTSKGKGFQGTVRRWNFSVARKTHGTKYIRHGSTMSSSITGRSKPGIKMPGHMGNAKVTLKNRTIVLVNTEKNVYAIKGAIPGASDSYIVLRSC
jgi:large subunit ribosomal protein L3